MAQTGPLNTVDHASQGVDQAPNLETFAMQIHSQLEERWVDDILRDAEERSYCMALLRLEMECDKDLQGKITIGGITFRPTAGRIMEISRILQGGVIREFLPFLIELGEAERQKSVYYLLLIAFNKWLPTLLPAFNTALESEDVLNARVKIGKSYYATNPVEKSCEVPNECDGEGREKGNHRFTVRAGEIVTVENFDPIEKKVVLKTHGDHPQSAMFSRHEFLSLFRLNRRAEKDGDLAKISPERIDGGLRALLNQNDEGSMQLLQGRKGDSSGAFQDAVISGAGRIVRERIFCQVVNDRTSAH